MPAEREDTAASDSGASPNRPARASGPAAAESPRLGVRHLVAWTAFAAVYFGVAATSGLVDPWQPAWIPRGAFWPPSAIHVYAGAALAGLFWFAMCRPWRASPRLYPGEILWLTWGFAVVWQWIVHLLAIVGLAWLARHVHGDMEVGVMVPWMLAFGITEIGVGLAFILAASTVRPVLWKTCFALMAALCFSRACLVYAAARGAFCNSPWPWQAAVVAMAAVLGIVVLLDHAAGRRYPWTHWAGIVLGFWIGAINLLALALETFRP